MDAFHERLIVRAATIDELLSDDFETLPGQKGDADVAGQRLAAWCRSCASGDWSLFSRRLARGRWSIDQVLARFATVRRKASAPTPPWIADATWIEAALQSLLAGAKPTMTAGQGEPCAFEHLLAPVVEQAETLLLSSIGAAAFDHLAESARSDLRRSLLVELSELFAPALYEMFAQARKAAATPADAAGHYGKFVAEMKAGGFRRLFTDKPVLLRVAAIIVRQWIDVSGEFVARLDADLAAICRELLFSNARSRVAAIEGDLSDPHNNGRSVRIVGFEDGARIVYKPKDLRLDVAWHALVERLNREGAPFELQAARAVARGGYGWTEFIAHTGCADVEGCRRFFHRAGAWLALFHCFSGNDMHQENLIAASDHPVPVDLETILQAEAEEHKSDEVEAQAFEAAMEIIANSVTSVGLLPVYAKSPDNDVFAMGGMVSDLTSATRLGWSNINSDTMQPVKSKEDGNALTNLPHVDGRYASFGDHIDDFIAGFEDYARFLLPRTQDDPRQGELFDGFAGALVRKVVRPTRFYYMLLRRLKNHRGMGDGVAWSAQADFLARLADWDNDNDSFWPLQRAKRAALLALNVPYFVLPCDGQEVRDATGISVRMKTPSGLTRAQVRTRGFDTRDIAWQVEVIRQNTSSLSRSAGPAMETRPLLRPETADTPSREVFLAEADRIAAWVSDGAIRRGPGAAWIGLDWLGDSEAWQLVALGPDLYNGLSGIALFLAAHAAVTGRAASAELALAAVAYLRKGLRGRNSARLARSLGLGGGSGLGSVVYALSVMSNLLNDDELLADAHAAAELFTDDLIAADKQLDILAGSAGGILGLLRLHRDSPSAGALARAAKCGEHLLAWPRLGVQGRRSWVGTGFGARLLNGMSHGAAGFAYALASLAAATGRGAFTEAASECIAFENANYDSKHGNWPDLRADGHRAFPCQWCHGAPGIGLARVAMRRRGGMDAKLLTADISNAVIGVEKNLFRYLDTLCCGILGNIEFLCEAGSALGRSALRERASRQLAAVMETAAAAGDYRWNAGSRRFNFGLFRGLAGVGYTVLRRAEESLPNVLVWE
jgi:type 2 lantibiotic biosynthesis protein LanM